MVERRRFDYSELEAAIAHADQVTLQTRRALETLCAAMAQLSRKQGEDRWEIALHPRPQ